MNHKDPAERATGEKRVRTGNVLTNLYEGAKNKFGIGTRRAHNSVYANASDLFRRMAHKSYESPLDVFRSNFERRNDFLYDFARKAVEEGFQPLEIAKTIIKFRYPVKLERYVDTSVDQAASAIVLASTTKINWFDMFTFGPIVEGGKLLNGIFGRKETKFDSGELSTPDEVADTLYLPKHDQKARLPQAPWIMFATKCRKSSDMEEQASIVRAHFNEFREELEMDIVNDYYLKLADKANRCTTKFRLMCIVFDMEAGKLFVVNGADGAKPVEFGKWVGENLRDVLSCDEQELGQMKKVVERKGGLLEQLRNPRNNDKDYRPWASLLEEIGDYKKATNIWRYATIQLQLESVKRYEANWKKIKKVEEILESIRKLGCDDGRHAADVKVLGGIMTEREFKEFSCNLGRMSLTELLKFAPHDGCGFLSTCIKLNNAMKRLRAAIYEDAQRVRTSAYATNGAAAAQIEEKVQFEYERNIDFFRKAFALMDKRTGSLRQQLVLADYLPQYLRDEYSDYNLGKAANNQENRDFVVMLHDIFVSKDEATRSVIRRALAVGVFESDPDTLFFSMPAAEKTYAKLHTFFGENYKERFGSAVNTFIIEEVARNTYEKYMQWMKELPEEKRFEVIMFLDNFHSGQSTEIPPEPFQPGEYGTVREDYFIKNFFTPQEREEFGLDRWAQWKIAA